MSLTTEASPAEAGLAGLTAGDLAAMREAAAAFIDRVSGGRTQYVWPDGRPHYMLPAGQLADQLLPAAPGTGEELLTAAGQQAAWLAGTVLAAVWFAGGTGTQTWRHFPAVAAPGWLAALPLPQPATPAQPAALLDSTGPGPIERHLDSATLRAAYEHRPRTRVLEDIGHGQPASWAALAGGYLTRLSGGPPVTSSLYESRHRDDTLPAHPDAWFGVILQVSGRKDWYLGYGLTDPGQPPPAQVTTAAGDLLLVPKNLPHRAATPASPGHSRHLTLALDRDHG